MSTISLSQIQVEIIRIGSPICVIIGNLDSFIGLFVFLQKSLRTNPCILFLIGYMLTNLIYIDFTILSVLLTGYGLDFSTKSLVFCRIRMYISFVFTSIPSYFLVMSSMDRMFISSSNVRIRQRSNRRFALLMIILISLFWIIFHLHAIFFSEIKLITGQRLSCTTQSGDPTTFVSYYGLINALIPITLMSIFGIKTLINIKRVNINYMRRTDRRLIILLIIQICFYIFLRLPISLYLIYGQITKFNVKTSKQILIEQFVYFVATFCQFIQVSISPLINLISNTFRIELIKALYKLFGLRWKINQGDVSLSQIRNINKNTLQMRQIMKHVHNKNAIQPIQN